MLRSSNSLDVVFCDWGGTLADGRGRPSSGARKILQELQGETRLVVASNAGDAAQVRALLEAGGIGCRLSAVVTAADLGVAKPAGSFYRELLSRFRVSPRRAAMVGDDYVADVTGAKSCGLRAYWYNPTGRPCPLPHPMHDGELGLLVDLPHLVRRRPLPDVADCMRLLSRGEGAERVMRHCLAVAEVSFCLAQELRARGVELDPLLVHRGGLLHDLDKVATLCSGHQHGALASLWLRRAGQGALATIAEQHVASALIDRSGDDLSREAMVVHYADKLVEEDRFVGLESRWRGLLSRYPQYRPVLEEAYPVLLVMEQQLASLLGRKPEQVLADRFAA